MNKLIIWLMMVLITIAGCKPEPYTAEIDDPEMIRASVKQLTDVIVHDIFSPPVASRIYAYPSIALYETMRMDHPEYQTLAGQLHDFDPIPLPTNKESIDFGIAGIYAFLKVGTTLIFSEEKMNKYTETLVLQFKQEGVPDWVIEASYAYGEQVAKHILDWSGKDNYKQTRTMPRFSVSDDTGRWTPTPPDYADAIEPHWNKIRPFIIDSATQFVPVPPPAFNMDKRSQFFSDLMEVYETVNNLNAEQKQIAEFWDCNPFVTHHQGHVMFATKKITPGGHWIGITDIATRQSKSDMMKTAEVYARVSIALADAFISCWDEKYRSNLIRPETVINEHIDENWVPILQTPPFPEYTSGHSVISTAAAVTLTDIYGDDFAFVDSTEVEYGLPVRKFDSFLDASSEAAISRLYGGIHYMPAIENGVAQGRRVGNYMVKNLITEIKTQANTTAE